MPGFTAPPAAHKGLPGTALRTTVVEKPKTTGLRRTVPQKFKTGMAYSFSSHQNPVVSIRSSPVRDGMDRYRPCRPGPDLLMGVSTGASGTVRRDSPEREGIGARDQGASLRQVRVP
jgi:hypothetical protein